MPKRQRETSLAHALRRNSPPVCQIAMGLLHGEYGSAEPYYWLHRKVQNEVNVLMAYEATNEVIRRRRYARYGANRRARGLLWQFLSEEQRGQLKRSGRRFIVEGSEGGLYAIYASSGQVEGVSRHGRSYYCDVQYCHHDEGFKLPGADLALGHLLLLRSDEPAFLAEANGRRVTDTEMRWNGAWRRTLREAADRRRVEIAAARERVVQMEGIVLRECRIQEGAA